MPAARPLHGLMGVADTGAPLADDDDDDDDDDGDGDEALHNGAQLNPPVAEAMG